MDKYKNTTQNKDEWKREQALKLDQQIMVLKAFPFPSFVRENVTVSTILANMKYVIIVK